MKGLLNFGIYVGMGMAAIVAAGQEEKPAEPGTGGAAMYDTLEVMQNGDGVSTQMPDAKWRRIAEGEKPKSFKGDAALLNGVLAGVVRKDGVELYAKGADGWNRRARLAPLVGQEIPKGVWIRVATNEADSVAVELKLTGEDERAIVFTLGARLPVIKVMPRGKVDGLRVHAPCRVGVLPDFFADDLVVDARQIPVARTEIPSEHFFLQMLADGASLLTAIWNKNEREVQVSLSGQGEQRVMDATDVFSGAGGSIWIAILEQKGIWHARDLAKEDGDKTLTMDWEVPFAAKWKGNFTREDKQIESRLFEITERPKTGQPWIGKNEQDGKLRAVVPAAPQRKAPDYVAPSGVLVVYPISRTKETPISQLLLDDLMRQSLGSGPCEYILDVAGRTSKGNAKGTVTCSYDAAVTGMLRGEKEAAGIVKEERVFFRSMHQNVLIFMKHIQDRINAYVDFRGEMLTFLANQGTKHPEQADFIAKLKKQVDKIGAEKAEGDRIVMPFLMEVQKAMSVDTPEQVEKARKPGYVRGIGGGQDNRLANCRRIVKVLRAMAAAEMTMGPAVGEIAKVIREKSQTILRNPAWHEHPAEKMSYAW